MSNSWIGSVVSLDCGETLGTYQGQVKSVDNVSQALTICNAFRNGLKCEVPTLTINAQDIKDLKIIRPSSNAHEFVNKPKTPSKLSKEAEKSINPGCRSPVKVVQAMSAGHAQQHNGYSGTNGYVTRLTPTRDVMYDNHYNGNRNNNARQTPTKDSDQSKRRNSFSESKGRKPTTPRKIDSSNNGRKSAPREDCFSAPVESFLSKEFDFEKNLALFDKRAVYEEIENGGTDVTKLADKKVVKYRCDENVLKAKPAVLKQIKVPTSPGIEYVTDSGLVVPSVTYSLRSRVLSMAQGYGYSLERQVEMVGRSASEMVLQLLGGSSRLNPQNDHQLPTVVVLCGPHMQGAEGISCGRHLSNHNVKTIVYVPNFVKMTDEVEKELVLYGLCDGKRTSSTKELPTGPVDMIVNALDSHEHSHFMDQSWYKSLTKWTNNKKAPCIAIDPPTEGSVIEAKWSLAVCLPLSAKTNSQVYLCDLGLPNKVFQEAGVTYVSPFSHKFVIALHQR